MELQDCAYPVLTTIIGTTDYKTAFEQVDIALLIGAKPRGPGMQRKDLLTANGAIFAGQGKALNQYASRSVKVCVVGNPANTNALIAAQNAPDLPKSAFTAMTRLDQNRAASQLASKLSVPVDNIKNVIIWGSEHIQRARASSLILCALAYVEYVALRLFSLPATTLRRRFLT